MKGQARPSAEEAKKQGAQEAQKQAEAKKKEAMKAAAAKGLTR